MSDTRREILRHLLHNKAGLTIEALAGRLGISRNAVQQHILSLQRDNLVGEAGAQTTGGRPSRLYALTEQGYETFPRRYDMLSSRTLQALKEVVGPEKLTEALEQVASRLAADLESDLAGTAGRERLQAVVRIMNDIGYEAATAENGKAIAALNCVYHHLARDVREVCRFDIELLRRLLGREIEHARCMATGDHECLFKLRD